ncbi:peptidoglycan DD-metalloendopeptidase family protein [Corynebacterium sp. USCH3]|uniref:peptidoglycan DD-metalloendopeptidase family protein n=1 Tax=Corynebacterium sp. USCH3 TaxID=3024840 RepID=UPI00403F2C28
MPTDRWTRRAVIRTLLASTAALAITTTSLSAVAAPIGTASGPPGPATQEQRVTPPHLRPVPGRVLVPADIPEKNWLPGHRGVDLYAMPGDTVSVSAAGTVHFAGVVAGTPVVSVNHADGVRTTYEPVLAAVSTGEHVTAGQNIGTLADTASLPASARRGDGLSWGARTGENHDRYIDPMSLLGPVVVRLWR